LALHAAVPVIKKSDIAVVYCSVAGGYGSAIDAPEIRFGDIPSASYHKPCVNRKKVHAMNISIGARVKGCPSSARIGCTDNIAIVARNKPRRIADKVQRIKREGKRP